LLITTRYGSVLALDRATGAVQWEIGTGLANARLRVSDRAVVAWTTFGLVVDHPRRVVAFALPQRALATELATIHGRVTRVACWKSSRAALDVGGERLEPAADGRFTARVRATGIVLVSGPASFDDDDDHRSSATVELTGAGDYTVPDLELGVCDRE
jgi:hypothetical protein